MIAVGVDLGKDRHAAAIFDGCGRRLAKTAFHDNSHDGAKRLWEAVEAVSDGEVRVGMEATGNCWKPLHDFLVARGAKVSV
ncbi:MAG: transposase, partial [Kiritimatiellae bacterium]|nr:transposase [Kiritimatiellia bacterium]